jgi:hypothetical protein
MTPPLLIVMPVTVLPSEVNVTVHVLVPVPPEALKAVEVVAVPYVVDGFDPPATVMPAFMVTVVVEELELV